MNKSNDIQWQSIYVFHLVWIVKWCCLCFTRKRYLAKNRSQKPYVHSRNGKQLEKMWCQLERYYIKWKNVEVSRKIRWIPESEVSIKVLQNRMHSFLYQASASYSIFSLASHDKYWTTRSEQSYGMIKAQHNHRFYQTARGCLKTSVAISVSGPNLFPWRQLLNTEVHRETFQVWISSSWQVLTLNTMVFPELKKCINWVWKAICLLVHRRRHWMILDVKGTGIETA